MAFPSVFLFGESVGLFCKQAPSHCLPLIPPRRPGTAAHLLGAATVFLPSRSSPPQRLAAHLGGVLGMPPCYRDEITGLFALQTLLMEILRDAFPLRQGWCARKLVFIYVLSSYYENLPSGHTYIMLYQCQRVNKCHIFA